MCRSTDLCLQCAALTTQSVSVLTCNAIIRWQLAGSTEVPVSCDCESLQISHLVQPCDQAVVAYSTVYTFH